MSDFLFMVIAPALGGGLAAASILWRIARLEQRLAEFERCQGPDVQARLLRERLSPNSR